jgi:hypothetical protein
VDCKNQAAHQDKPVMHLLFFNVRHSRKFGRNAHRTAQGIVEILNGSFRRFGGVVVGYDAGSDKECQRGGKVIGFAVLCDLGFVGLFYFSKKIG